MKKYIFLALLTMGVSSCQLVDVLDQKPEFEADLLRKNLSNTYLHSDLGIPNPLSLTDIIIDSPLLSQ